VESYGMPDGKETFVAFVDVSGFKNHMKRGKGAGALNTFYNAGYRQLGNSQNCIDGIFVSDRSL
jgi:hypothetical protein